MNFPADEGVVFPVVQRLRSDGHEVLYVAEMAPGVSDERVLAAANAKNALLLRHPTRISLNWSIDCVASLPVSYLCISLACLLPPKLSLIHLSFMTMARGLSMPSR